MDLNSTFQSIQSLIGTLARVGGPFQWLLVVMAVALAGFALIPGARRWQGWAITVAASVLLAGEAALAWFHYRLWQTCAVADPATGVVTGHVAVPLWIESEKLYVWALSVAVLGAIMRTHRKEMLSGVLLVTAVLMAGAALLGKPFTQPVPNFLGQYMGYLQATSMGGQAAAQAFQGMEASRQFYYNAWYMWVHPPLLFFGYGCFALSFVATMRMIVVRHSSYETTAYRWARLGYLPVTFAMLIGFPWAILAWSGESWWWSGKVNMSLMMWLLYTAYLHARLYLRRRGMWKAVAALSVLSFTILVMTYATTYLVPGAHSYASLADPAVAMLASITGGGS